MVCQFSVVVICHTCDEVGHTADSEIGGRKQNNHAGCVVSGGVVGDRPHRRQRHQEVIKVVARLILDESAAKQPHAERRQRVQEGEEQHERARDRAQRAEARPNDLPRACAQEG